MPRDGLEIHGTTGALMFAVLLAAILLAGIRCQSEPAAAVAIAALAIVALAARRYAAIVAERAGRGETTGLLDRFKLAGSSATVATSIIVLSGLAFLAAYFGNMKLVYETYVASHWSPYTDLGVVTVSACLGLTLALSVGARLRRALWLYTPAPPLLRRLRPAFRPLAVAALIGLTLGAIEMRSRWSSCTMMAGYHDQQVRAAIQIDDTKLARSHAALADWYRHTTWRPWLPIDPPSERSRTRATIRGRSRPTP
jgi:hypothetical protein